MTAHQRPPSSISRNDTAQQQAQQTRLPAHRVARGQRIQCHACVGRPMTTAGRARTYQCELKHDRNCHQCDKAGGSRDEQKRGHARAHLHVHWRRAPHTVAHRRILRRHAPERGGRVPLSFQQLTPRDEDITHCFLPYSSPRWSTTTSIDR